MLYWLQSDSLDTANATTLCPQSSVSRPLGPFLSSGFASPEMYVTAFFFFLAEYFFFTCSENFKLCMDHVFKISSIFTGLRSPFLCLHWFTSPSIRVGSGERRTGYFRSHDKIRWNRAQIICRAASRTGTEVFSCCSVEEKEPNEGSGLGPSPSWTEGWKGKRPVGPENVQ